MDRRNGGEAPIGAAVSRLFTAEGYGAGPAATNGHRRKVYCVVPGELAERLHEPLRRHFRDQPSIEVIVERRADERRSGSDRRLPPDPASPHGTAATAAVWKGPDRRRIADPSGRRVGDRRAPTKNAKPPQLPRRAQRHAEQLAFVERLVPSTLDVEDADSARLVARIQAGDSNLFSELYLRYFSRAYGYVRVALRDPHEAEDVTQQVFMEVFRSLSSYEHRRQPFRAWLFTIVRNRTIDALRRGGKLEIAEPDEIDRRREEREEPADEGRQMVDWLTDHDLQVVIERLPVLQRQVLMLRFVVGLSHAEIGQVLDRNEPAVRVLQHRALRHLRQRLTALGRHPRVGHRAAPAARLMRRSRVAYARRFSLFATGARR